MTSRGQFERLIGEGQVLAFEPDLFISAKLVLRYLPGYLVEGRFCLFPSLRCHFHPFFYSWDRSLLAPAIIQAGEVA